MQRINVYSFPRSGTNLFAAHMNLHPNIFSVNTGGGRIVDFPLHDFHKYPLFLDGINYVKDEIKFVLLDEVRPECEEAPNKSIVLLRNYNSMIKSQLSKWGGIIQSPEQYQKLVTIAQSSNVLAIQTETLILYPKEVTDLIKKYLNLDYFPTKKEIIDKGCHCGTKFITKKIIDVPDEPKKYDKPRTYYFCEKCNHVLAAPGGFNPYQDFIKEKVTMDRNWSVEEMNRQWNNHYINNPNYMEKK